MLNANKFSPCPRSSWTWAFLCAAISPCGSTIVAALGIGLVAASACGRREPAELPLLVQVAEVDSGTRETILVEKVALGDVDLLSFAYVKRLKDLLLDNPDSIFTAAGVADLGSLPNLRHLRIRGHGIDDAALAHI